jgi:O-antigen ligase
MIAVLIAFIAFFSPLLAGFWNFNLQILIHLFVFLIIALWVSQCIIKNELPDVFQDRKKFLLIFVVIVSAASLVLSPVQNLISHEWKNFFIGIIVIFLSPFLKPKETKMVNFCLRMSAWFVTLLAVYQTLFLKESMPYSSLINPNALAMFTLMMIPLSISWRDWPLSGLLIITLGLTKSSGAILSMAVIGTIYLISRNFSSKGGQSPFGDSPLMKNRWWTYALVIFILAGAIFAFSEFNLKSISDRIMWWKTAFSMILERPLFGFGFAGFTYVYPAFHKPVESQISTIYVHNYYLEFILENGLICAFLWFGFLFSAIKKLNPAGKYSIMAALIHSIVDFGLSMPSNLWVFSFILSSSPINLLKGDSGANGATVTLKNEYKISILIIVFALTGFYISQSLRILKTEHLLLKSLSLYNAGNHEDAIKELKSARVSDINNPVVPELLGKIYFEESIKTRDNLLLFESAVWFEQSLRLNPYNQSVYRRLQTVYEMAKETKLRNDLLSRRGKYFKW